MKIGEIYFNLNENKSNLTVKYDSEHLISINVDVFFEDGIYNDLDVSPHIEINDIKTSENKIDDLKGIMFEINDVNESYDRGDNFYLYESEPFAKYKIEILENNWHKAHIKLIGTGITDGYSKPYKTDNFIVDAIVPIRIYNNNSNISKEEKEIKNKVIERNKFKDIVPIVVFALISGFMSTVFLMGFIKIEKDIKYIIISIIMFLGFLISLCIIFDKVLSERKNKNQRKPISKIVKDMLTEDTYNKLKKLYIGELDITFFEKENIDASQYGFRYNDLLDEMINEWPGNEYVIIGYDSTAGCGPDTYIMKTDEKELPIYWLMTAGGDWKNPNKIANSFNDFVKIIECINENLNSEKELNKELILSEIAKNNSNENMEYWKNLLEHDVENNY